jgi:hypothetical protein
LTGLLQGKFKSLSKIVLNREALSTITHPTTMKDNCLATFSDFLDLKWQNSSSALMLENSISFNIHLGIYHHSLDFLEQNLSIS